ncbi:MAG: hypothetical protein Q8K75_12925 [Chlamydiales bacterium]|nr:hypothetical protein [Chlamydiales bacterium]
MIPILYTLPIGTALAGYLGLTAVVYLALRNKDELIDAMIDGAASRFLNRDALLKEVDKMDLRDQVSSLLAEKVDSVLEKFKQKTPMVALFMNDSIKATIKDLVVSEVISELPALQRTLAGKALDHFDLPTLLKDKLSQLDLHSIITQQLKPAQFVASGIGFAVGVLHLILLAFFI